MEPLDNQGQHDTHDKEIPSQKTRLTNFIKALSKQNPTSTALAFVVIFLLLTAIAVTINGVQTRQETQSIAQNSLFPTVGGCAGSGIGEGCPPTPTSILNKDLRKVPTLEPWKPGDPVRVGPGQTEPSQPAQQQQTPTAQPTGQPTPTSPPAQTPTNNSVQQPTTNNDVWTRIVKALQDLITVLGRLFNIFPTTPPAQPTPIAQLATQAPTQATPTALTPAQQSPQSLPSASSTNPQVSQPAPTAKAARGSGVKILPGQGVTFQQVDFTPPRPPVPNSDRGRVAVDADALLRSAGMSSGYINIFTDQGWIIHNLSVDVKGPSRVVEYFSLGLSQPTDVTQLSAYVVYSAKAQVSFQDGPRSVFPVGTTEWNAQGAGP
jgi:hypothetical protein